MKFNWDEFKKEMIAVHCKTEEEVNDFYKNIHEHNIFLEFENMNYWKGENGNVCYTFHKIKKCVSCFRYCYCTKKYGYEIIEWSDYMNIKKEFTKSDLENGMIVEQRNGDRRIVLNNNLIGLNGFNFLKNYKEDLTEYAKHTELDIVKVYKVKEECSSGLTYLLVNQQLESYLELEQLENYLDLVWKREENKEMTLEEIEKELGYKIKIVNNKN